MEHPFNIIVFFGEKFGVAPEWLWRNIYVLTSAFVGLLLIVISAAAYIMIKRTPINKAPTGKLSFMNLLDVFIESFYGLLEGILGKEEALRHLPFIGTIFVYILAANLIAFIPGFLPPTANINTNLACAIVVFIYYNAYGVKKLGAKHYFKKLLGPVIWLAPLMFFIELTSHIVRPVSLSVRLFGNIAGDHLVVATFEGLVPVLLPVVFMALGFLVSVIQAFIFAVLSAMYIALAIEEE